MACSGLLRKKWIGIQSLGDQAIIQALGSINEMASRIVLLGFDHAKFPNNDLPPPTRSLMFLLRDAPASTMLATSKNRVKHEQRMVSPL